MLHPALTPLPGSADLKFARFVCSGTLDLFSFLYRTSGMSSLASRHLQASTFFSFLQSSLGSDHDLLGQVCFERYSSVPNGKGLEDVVSHAEFTKRVLEVLARVR